MSCAGFDIREEGLTEQFLKVNFFSKKTEENYREQIQKDDLTVEKC